MKTLLALIAVVAILGVATSLGAAAPQQRAPAGVFQGTITKVDARVRTVTVKGGGIEATFPVMHPGTLPGVGTRIKITFTCDTEAKKYTLTIEW